MTVYAISDLHMSMGDKPMDIFGSNWENHTERIFEDWRSRVNDEDIVLLPGDFSWAMYLEEAGGHIADVGALPGRKILLKGNHDYWWSAIGKVRAALPEGMYALQNDAVELDGFVFAGTRGWLLPGQETDAQDRKIFERELIRMRMSLEKARRVSPDGRLIVMTHFPPATAAMTDTPVTELLDEYGPENVVYGHLHGQSTKAAYSGNRGVSRYDLVSCDALDFKLLKITQ